MLLSASVVVVSASVERFGVSLIRGFLSKGPGNRGQLKCLGKFCQFHCFLRVFFLYLTVISTETKNGGKGFEFVFYYFINVLHIYNTIFCVIS